MGFFQEYLLESKPPKVVELAKDTKQNEVLFTTDSLWSSNEHTISKDTRFKLKRELEGVYFKDPINFNAINIRTEMIMSAKHEISGEKGVVNKFKSFLDNIGLVGNDITFEELLEISMKYPDIYGEAFLYLVPDEKDKIIDLWFLDPKRVDYAKNSSDNVIFDQSNKPIGFIFKLSPSMFFKGDPIPIELERYLKIDGGEVFILYKRIAHFKGRTAGDGLYPVGLLEPSYKSVIRKHNIEEAQTNSIYARGTYPIIGYVGNERKVATAQDLVSVTERLKKLQYNRYLAFPDWVRIEAVEAKQSDVVQNTLDYLKINQSSSLGMPLAFASGSGEATNRATLNNQQAMLEFTLNSKIRKTVMTWEKFVFRRIAKSNGIKGLPTIKWDLVDVEGTEEKSRRINNAVKNGILSPEEARKMILVLEGEDENFNGMSDIQRTRPPSKAESSDN